MFQSMQCFNIYRLFLEKKASGLLFNKLQIRKKQTSRPKIKFSNVEQKQLHFA